MIDKEFLTSCLGYCSVGFGFFWVIVYLRRFYRQFALDRKYRLKEQSHEDILQQIRAFLKRSIEETPVGIDIPRLCRRVAIFKDGEYAGGTNPEITIDTDVHEDNTRAEVVFNIIQKLAFSLEEMEILEYLHEKREEFLETSNDLLSNAVQRLLQGPLRDDNFVTVQLLKMFNQGMIAPGVIDFKRRLAGTIPHRDINNSWSVFVDLFCSGSPSRTSKYHETPDWATSSSIHFVHRVLQRKRSEDPSGAYSFVWNMEIFLDESAVAVGMRNFVTDIFFLQHVTHQSKKHLMAIMDAYHKVHKEAPPTMTVLKESADSTEIGDHFRRKKEN